MNKHFYYYKSPPMRPMYKVTKQDLVDFWHTQANPVHAISQSLFKAFSDVVFGGLNAMMDVMPQSMTYEKRLAIVWWVHLYMTCEMDISIIPNCVWIFNTPDHPFEAFLVNKLYAEKGMDAYGTYCTQYPAE